MAKAAKATEPVRAAVYLATDEDKALAHKLLDKKELDAAEHFSGVIEGDLDPGRLRELDEAGLVVTPIDGAVHHPGRQRKWIAENATEIEDLKDKGRSIALNEAGDALVVDTTPDDPDPRLHQGAVATPAPRDALDLDAYNITVDGPITREERLELDRLGVDIAALEPGFGYRTMLTRKQYGEVRKLDFVDGVTRYRFEQTVTPALLDFAEREEEDRPSLLGDSDAAPEPQVFDCILHREADLDKVVKLLDKTKGIEVTEQTNLRIRFQADPDPSLIAAVASLPEVRKVSPYKVPTL